MKSSAVAFDSVRLFLCGLSLSRCLPSSWSLWDSIWWSLGLCCGVTTVSRYIISSSFWRKFM